MSSYVGLLVGPMLTSQISSFYSSVYLIGEKKEETGIKAKNWEEEQQKKEEDRRRREQEAWEREQRELEMLTGRSSPLVCTVKHRPDKAIFY